MSRARVFVGRGLHSGAVTDLTLMADQGLASLLIKLEDEEPLALDQFRCASSARSTSIVAGGLVLRTVEHLFAALAATSTRAGLLVHVRGGEVPLVDGGARSFVDALLGLELPCSPPKTVITRDGTIEVEGSVYELRRGPEPEVVVEIDFDDGRLEPRASWSSSLEDFRERVAPARTFAFEDEVAALAAAGLASHVAKESVVVIGRDRVLSAGAPFHWDEPARHKLLDLIGDLYLYGGPPRGRLFAYRPGHARTHAAMRRALEEGMLALSQP